MPPPSQAALQAQPDFSKSVLSLVLSLSPLYFLATSRSTYTLFSSISEGPQSPGDGDDDPDLIISWLTFTRFHSRPGTRPAACRTTAGPDTPRAQDRPRLPPLRLILQAGPSTSDLATSPHPHRRQERRFRTRHHSYHRYLVQEAADKARRRQIGEEVEDAGTLSPPCQSTSSRPSPSVPRRQARRDRRQLPLHHQPRLPRLHPLFSHDCHLPRPARRVDIDVCRCRHRSSAAPDEQGALRDLRNVP